ncbi:MAG: Indolepyruvate ferredoxin oxidoreductase alpha and beta subunits-like protein [Methanomicrobiales archaeon 53_19]|uniref:thiamine pyrophosphate-dependent enzyme n=1 Tax=Methanocalculus sp. TaxID=2004547 RepID=UPI000747AB2B|nr:thiamine pyrophosphate-dependent enzyme [Methanocalculus sp.]KUK69427.1 MAG: Indolepyruvate ferredoxin oxidoreductase alpha and beta subunits-like protein [Methanocalculus sp. 52_23]KUL04429.1 MAG: Indolepyruvate ferredoxin oxidoreductase alpha and beta subunits-like protein [Methanomicrobiales archaeon 53_19]HIJ06989.1 indolepyruvate ferredoxin oxidoreductase [Methanocalculus sp.]
MKGYEAVAEALRDCVDTVYTVPGYPVTEIGDCVSALMVTNEKTALEYALGDSLSGRRSCVIVKHVGMNALCDPLLNATTQGLVSGVVIIVGDDPEALFSQNSQDSRYFGELAQCPVIEPDRETLSAAVAAAFEASERFSRVAILRITPTLLNEDIQPVEAVQMIRHGRVADRDLTIGGRIARAEKGTAGLFAWAERSPLNRIKGGVVEIGVGAVGGESHIAIPYPPPSIPSGSRIIEIGRPFVREHQQLLPPQSGRSLERFTDRGFFRTFCRNCPFKPLFSLMKERKMQVIPDIGCSFLLMNPPYSLGIASYCLGSSIAVAAQSTGVAVIGDGALLHSGINSLIDCREKDIPLLVIVLANSRMAMTGGQSVPDIAPYLSWADPLEIPTEDTEALSDALFIPETGQKVIIVRGRCPEEAAYEKVEC